jgi:serine/threonine protein kinase
MLSVDEYNRRFTDDMLIGTGVHALVMEAQDNVRRQRVATKMLTSLTDKPVSQRTLDKWRRAIVLSQRLWEACDGACARVFEILRLTDAYRHVTPVLVMELVRDTRSLYDPAVKTRQAYPEYFFALATSVMDLLACMHAAGLVHTDAHGANILLRRNGRPVLVDLDGLCEPGAPEIEPGAGAAPPTWCFDKSRAAFHVPGFDPHSVKSRRASDVYNVLVTLLFNDIFRDFSDERQDLAKALDARINRAHEDGPQGIESLRGYIRTHVAEPDKAAFYIQTLALGGQAPGAVPGAAEAARLARDYGGEASAKLLRGWAATASAAASAAPPA